MKAKTCASQSPTKCNECGGVIETGETFMLYGNRNSRGMTWVRTCCECLARRVDRAAERNRATVEARGDVLPNSFAEDIRCGEVKHE